MNNNDRNDDSKEFENNSNAVKIINDSQSVIIFYGGSEDPLDHQKAFDLLVGAAEKGDKEAQLSLGKMYENGTVVHQDYVKAAEWYTKAAEQGLREAQFALGTM